MTADAPSAPTGRLFEWALLVPQDAVETLSEALEALEALSVSVEDADAETPAEQALFGEPGMPAPQAGWARSRLVALFATEAGVQEALQIISLQGFFAGCTSLGICAVDDQDWVRLTQSQFAPVDIAPGFWIVPSWHETPADAQQVIELDPGLAFGTGTHPTTRMCLRWIARHDLRGQRVLDYGCGSGILAIGAGKFGAASIVAVDIDPAAVESTRVNARHNQVDVSVGLPDLAEGRFNLVLANILATPLQVLAPLLCSHLAAGGQLVLAGILERQADLLKAAYAPWVSLDVADTEDGWILMTAAAPLPA